MMTDSVPFSWAGGSTGVSPHLGTESQFRSARTVETIKPTADLNIRRVDIDNQLNLVWQLHGREQSSEPLS